jgi:hypothetical protein
LKTFNERGSFSFYPFSLLLLLLLHLSPLFFTNSTDFTAGGRASSEQQCSASTASNGTRERDIYKYNYALETNTSRHTAAAANK